MRLRFSRQVVKADARDRNEPRRKRVEPGAVVKRRQQPGVDQKSDAADEREAEEARRLRLRERRASATALRAPAR